METFLTSELPGYSGRQQGHLPHRQCGGRVVDVGSAAPTLAAYYPGQFRYAASLSGYLNLSQGLWPTAGHLVMLDAGGFNSVAMWGLGGRARPGRNDPTVNELGKLVANGTRIWVYRGHRAPGVAGSGGRRRRRSGAGRPSPWTATRTSPASTRARRQQRHVQLPVQRHARLGLLGQPAQRHEGQTSRPRWALEAGTGHQPATWRRPASRRMTSRSTMNATGPDQMPSRPQP